MNIGTQIARQAESHGHWIAGGRISTRISWARTLSVGSGDKALFADLLYELIGTSVASQESVVVSFALAQQVASGDMNAFEALCLAASLGGDTDTIAAMLGAMLGRAWACSAGLRRWLNRSSESMAWTCSRWSKPYWPCDKHGTNCGSWLACDSGFPVADELVAPPQSQASQLPH